VPKAACYDRLSSSFFDTRIFIVPPWFHSHALFHRLLLMVVRAYIIYIYNWRRNMGTIVDGVEFDTVAREWRCKWSADNEKASLASAQKALDSVLAEVKAVDGVKGVQRVVCGGCLDFKVRRDIYYISIYYISILDSLAADSIYIGYRYSLERTCRKGQSAPHFTQ
jgi:hypothetical protein